MNPTPTTNTNPPESNKTCGAVSGSTAPGGGWDLPLRHHMLGVVRRPVGLGIIEVGLGIIEEGLGIIEVGLGSIEVGLGIIEVGLGIIEVGLGIIEHK